MILNDEIEILTCLGLTPWQAKVYFALVQTGTATVRTISKFSGIPRQHIYKVASTLQETGLVEKAITKPFKYKAIPLPDGLSILMERRNREHNKLYEKIGELTKRHKKKKTMLPLEGEESQFILIPEKKADILKRKNALENAEKSLDVITLWNRHSFVERFYLESVEEALHRGVKMRVVVWRPEDAPIPKDIENIKSHLYQVRYIRISPSALVSIYDKKEVFMPISETSGYGEVPTLWSKNPSLIAIAQNYFETMWLKAMEEIPEEYQSQ